MSNGPGCPVCGVAPFMLHKPDCWLMLKNMKALGQAVEVTSRQLPTDAKIRKDAPMARGLLDYFPDALFAVAELSRIGSEQHNPGEPMRWAKEKSTDEADCIIRHLVDRGKLDTDGVRHSAKVAWRALALLQREIETDGALDMLEMEGGSRSTREKNA